MPRPDQRQEQDEDEVGGLALLGPLPGPPRFADQIDGAHDHRDPDHESDQFEGEDTWTCDLSGHATASCCHCFLCHYWYCRVTARPVLRPSGWGSRRVRLRPVRTLEGSMTECAMRMDGAAVYCGAL